MKITTQALILKATFMIFIVKVNPDNPDTRKDSSF